MGKCIGLLLLTALLASPWRARADADPAEIEKATKAMAAAAESLRRTRDKLAGDLEARLRADEKVEPGRDFFFMLDDGADGEEMHVTLRRRGGKWLEAYAVVPRWRQEDRTQVFHYLHRDGASATMRDKIFYPVDASSLELEGGNLTGHFEALLRLKWLRHEHMKPGFRYKYTTDRRWSRVDQWRTIPHSTPRPQRYEIKGNLQSDKQEFALTLQYHGRPLPVRFRLPPEPWERPKVIMPHLNVGVHEGDFSGLRFKDGRLTGTARIEINPDPFVLQHIHVVTYKLDGKAQSGRIAGTFEGSAKKGKRLKIEGQSRGAVAVDAPESFSGQFFGTVLDAIDARYEATGAMGRSQGRIAGGSHPAQLAVTALLSTPPEVPDDPIQALNAYAGSATRLYEDITALQQCLADYPYPPELALAKARVPMPRWDATTADAVAAALDYVDRLKSMSRAPADLPPAIEGRPAPGDKQFGPYYDNKPLAKPDADPDRIPRTDSSAKAQRWRFVGRWDVIGPFPQVRGPEASASGLPGLMPAAGASYEKPSRLGFTAPDEDGRLRTHAVASSDGVVRAPSWGKDRRGQVMRPGYPDSVWYAAAAVSSDVDQDVWLAVDTGNHARLWINDRLAWVDREHEWVEDDLQVAVFKARLEKGVNRLLARCRDDRGGSWFSLHVCTAGRPATEDEFAKRQAEAARPATYGGDMRVYPDATPALAWDVEKGINIDWRYSLPGGSSRAAIVGDRVFISSPECRLHCVDRETGEEEWVKESSIWEFLGDDARKEWESTPEGGKRWDTFRRLTGFSRFGPDATPVSDGHHVWVHYGIGITACYDLEGNRMWTRRTHMTDSTLLLVEKTEGEGAIESVILVGNVTEKWGEENEISAEGWTARHAHGVMSFDPNTGRTVWVRAGDGALRVESQPSGGVVGRMSSSARYPLLMCGSSAGRGTTSLITPTGQVLDATTGEVLRSKLSLPGLCWPSVTQHGGMLYAATEGTHSAGEVWMDHAGQIGCRMLWRGQRHYAFAAGGSGGTVFDGTWVYSLRRVNEHAKHCPASALVLDWYDPVTGHTEDWIKPVLRGSNVPFFPVLAGEYMFLSEGRGEGAHMGGPPGTRAVDVIRTGRQPFVVCSNPMPYASGIPTFDGSLMVMRCRNELVAVSVKGVEGRRYQDLRIAETMAEKLVPQPEPGVRRIAALRGAAPHGGTPVDKLFDKESLYRWLVAGPFPKSSGELPALLADVTAALPGTGAKLTAGGKTHALRPFPREQINAVTGFSNDGRMDDWQARNTSRTLRLEPFADQDPAGTVYLFTVVDNTQDRVVFSQFGGSGVDLWLGGEAVKSGEQVRLAPGLYPLVVRVRLPALAREKYGFRPSFKEAVDPQKACHAWLGQLAPRRGLLARIVASMPESEHARKAAGWLGHLREDDMRRDVLATARAWRNDGSGRFPRAWPPVPWERHANLKWAVTLPGRGMSAPVAAGQRIFMGAENAALLCCDAADGKVLWEQRLWKSKGPIGMSAPVVRDGTVFVACAEGMVQAFGLDGVLKWKTMIPAMRSRAARPGLAAAGDVLVAQCGKLVGLRMTDGEELWTSSVAVSPDTAPPVMAQIGGDFAVLTAGGAVVRSADGMGVADGLSNTGNVAPQLGNGVAYYAGRSKTSACRLPSKLIRGAQVERLWEAAGHTPAGTPLLHGGRIFLVTTDGKLVTLDAEDGRELSVKRLGASGKRPPDLLLGGDNLYAVNVGGDGTRTVILRPDHRLTKVWEYAVEGGCDGLSFIGRNQFVLSGNRLYAVAGKGPAEPEPVGGPEIAAVAIKPGRGVPIAPFESNRIAGKWLFAGPFYPRSLETDFLKAISGRGRATPEAGQEVMNGGKTVTFAALTDQQTWLHGKFTGGVKSLDVTTTVPKELESTVYYYTVIDNDEPRDVEFKLFSPRGEQWNTPELFQAIALVGGQPVKENEAVYLQTGKIPVMIQVSKGAMKGGGKIWFAPRFVDRSGRYARKREEFARACKVWHDYQAHKDELFVLK